MKEIFISILRPVVKGLYRLMKKQKRNSVMLPISSIIRYDNTVPAASHEAAGSNLRRFTQGKRRKYFWKDKRFIATASAAAVIIAVVLSIVLPLSNASAETSAVAFMPSEQTNTDFLPEPSSVSDDILLKPHTTSHFSEQQVGQSADRTNGDSSTDPMVSESEPESTASPDSEPVPTTAPDKPDLVPGCTDPRILDVQERLMELGYMGTEEPTDHYGYGTEYALQLFQRKHSLQVDGLLGEQTQAALFSESAMPYTVKLGDKGTDVSGIQERLQELKYLKAGSTGYFGTDTETAVKGFQKRNGLSVDGNVGENTLEAIYSEDAKPAKTSSSSGSGSGSGSGSSSGSSGGGNSGGGDASQPPPGDPDEASADALIEFAKTQLGKKYVRGGKGPDVFDCSGFVYYCLNQVGYKIKYMTSAGWAKSSLPKVSKMSDLQKGDIVCFKGHVGIYLGGEKMIDASSSQGKIRICSNIYDSSYWTRNFICGRRVF